MSPRKHDVDSEDDYEPGRKSKQAKKEHDHSSDSSVSWDSDDSRNDQRAQKRKKAESRSPRKTAATPSKKPAIVRVASKASILSLASDSGPGRQSANERLAGIDNSVLEKIKKALALGGHKTTSEGEAKRAMRLATKLMAQHNVDQADIIATEEDSAKLKRAKQSTIAIRSTDHTKGVIMHSWEETAAHAVETFFDCKSYTTSMDDPDRDKIVRIDRTFYGLCEQTVTAAFAYEMVYNLILTWSAQNKAAKGRSGKNNYCHGVADGLGKMAEKEKEEEEKRAIKKEKGRLESACKAEEQEHKRALDRLKGPSLSPEEPPVKKEYLDVKIEDLSGGESIGGRLKEDTMKVKVEDVPDVDVPPSTAQKNFAYRDAQGDDSDNDDIGLNRSRYVGDDAFEARADFKYGDDDDDDMGWIAQDWNEDIKPLAPASRSPPSPAVLGTVKVEENATPWSSAQQLTLFRDNASFIADEYLKQNDIEVYTLRQRLGPNLATAQDMAVYKQGQNDAKNIDVKRKRIKDVDED